jgi:hypothetical protein
MHDIILPAEPVCTLTRDQLLAEGFIYQFDAMTASGQDPDEHDDPYYYFKGDFKIYDVIEDFYYRGGKVYTLEQVKALYEAETGRNYTPSIVLPDSEVPDYKFTGKTDAKKFVKAKLHGGPGDGLTVAWPRGVMFFVFEHKTDNGKKEAFRYRRKDGTKSVFLYAGPLQ